MIKRIFSLRKDELIRGSFVLMIMIGIFNIFNYIFQVSMARMLGPAEFSVFAVLMSAIYIFGIPGEAIQAAVSRYASRFSLENKPGKIKDLMYKSLKKLSYLSALVFVLFVIFSVWLSALLEIDFWMFILTGLFIFMAFILPIQRGIMQGEKKFYPLGINMASESFIKLILGVLLVAIGFRAYGAMAGILIGSISAFFFSFSSIKNIIKSKREQGNFKGIYRHNLPMLIAITSIVLIYSLDIIIARAVFSPEIAGKYSFVSLIGKTILFISFAIGKAMFPLSSEKFEKKKSSSGLVKKSLILVLIISIVALFFYFFFPKEVIKILSLGSSQYTDTSGILFISGLSFSFMSLSYILVLYCASVNKIRKSSIGMLFFVLLEAILLIFFGSSLLRFVLSILVVSILMFIYLLFVAKK